MGSKRIALIVVALAGVGWQGRAMGALSASAVLTPQQLGPNSWRYSLTLSDTGSTPIGSFWFSWIPGENFMPTAASAISSPATWSGSSMNFGATDGNSVLWSTSSPLAAGQSLGGFAFDSTSPPAKLAANSPFYPTTPVGTSFVYHGALFSDAGFEFVAKTVPPGDADEDGKVAFADLVVLARHYGMSSATWTDGDFNGDGKVGFDDLVILARNYGQTLPAGALAAFSPAFQADAARAFAQVPEPSAATLVLSLVAVAICRQRR